MNISKYKCHKSNLENKTDKRIIYYSQLYE